MSQHFLRPQVANQSAGVCCRRSGGCQQPATVLCASRHAPLLLRRSLHIASTRPELLCAARAGAGAGRGSASPAQSGKPAKTKGGVDPVKEAHKVFDEVFITVKSGNGGRGEIVEAGRGKWVDNFKYKPGGNLPKRMWLPASDPADGADGADVVIKCDPEVDNLLHLHQRSVYSARNGSNANPAVGSAGPKKNKRIKKASTSALVISVPPGTVVKRKSTGALVGELLNPGDMLVVARGGKGGSGVRAPTREANKRELDRQRKLAEETGAEVVAVEDGNWQEETKGLPGTQLSLHLLLRVVADIGIVGFPNAGKSSLLKTLTRASPEVAPYPFTTLMPNLGVLVPEGHSAAQDTADQGANSKRKASKAPVLADLPGLIEGAHKGRGLGRMFLRHLRRTSALLHVVDASAADPATDYYAVREELRMYNPEYCAKPHVVALNKMDMEDAGGLRDELVAAILATAQRHCKEWEEEEIQPTMPVAVVPCSALSGEGLEGLRAAMQGALDGPSASSPPQGQKGQRAAAAKQGLATAFATALGGAAVGLEEGKVEVAGDAELEEQERALLGLSEDELLARLGEGGVAGSVGKSVEASGAESAGGDGDDGWSTPPPAGFAEALKQAGLTGGRAGLFQQEAEGEWDEDEEGEWFEEGEDGEGEGEEVAEEGEGAGLGELGPEEAALLELSEEQLLELVESGEEGLPKVPSLNDLPDA